MTPSCTSEHDLHIVAGESRQEPTLRRFPQRAFWLGDFSSVWKWLRSAFHVLEQPPHPFVFPMFLQKRLNQKVRPGVAHLPQNAIWAARVLSVTLDWTVPPG